MADSRDKISFHSQIFLVGKHDTLIVFNPNHLDAIFFFCFIDLKTRGLIQLFNVLTSIELIYSCASYSVRVMKDEF